jgi:hypothetical protein
VVVASGPWLLLHASVVFWKLDVHFFEVHKLIFFRFAVLLCFPLRFFQALLVREVYFFHPSEICVGHFVFAVLNKQCYLLGGLEAFLFLFFVCLLLGHQCQLDGEVMTFCKCRRGSWFQLQFGGRLFGGRLFGVVLSLFPLCVWSASWYQLM